MNEIDMIKKAEEEMIPGFSGGAKAEKPPC